MTTEKATKVSALVIIPARGGSKGIPHKNLQEVGRTTLVARAIKASLASSHVTTVIVSTDSELIATEARRNGALVFTRPAQLATDTASSETALADALTQYLTQGNPEPEVVVFVQCTSPFIDPESISNAITTVATGLADVVFSAVEDHSFRWTTNPDGAACAVGHDAMHRLRRQELPPSYRETGAFYAMQTTGFLEHGNRFFGRIRLQPVSLRDSFEIDTLEDLEICRALSTHVAKSSVAPDTLTVEGCQVTGAEIDALVTDFDGVHTNDTAIVSADGSEHVQVSRSDGMGVARLKAAGIPFLILSSETNPIVRARAKKLGVDVLQGISNKADALNAWLSANRLDPARVAYVGNDVNDLPAMRLVGWPIAVADARPEAKAAARLLLTKNGGHGAVREICETILADYTVTKQTSPHSHTSQSLVADFGTEVDSTVDTPCPPTPSPS